jgi:spermidine synthase
MVIYTEKTADGRLVIKEEDGVRELYVKGALESAMYCNAGPEEPVFPYLVQLRTWIRGHRDIRTILLIGAGGFQLPRAVLYDRNDVEVTACEISPVMIDVSRKYFDLEKLEEKPQFHLQEADGFAWLKDSQEKFDLIINDAFHGNHPVGLNREDTLCVRRHLKEGGTYVINCVTAPKGLFSKRRKVTSTLHEAFETVDWMLVDEDLSLHEVQNCLVFAR